MSIPNKMKTFRSDHTYAKKTLKRIDYLMKQNDAQAWREIEECYSELSGVFGTLQQYAMENNIAKESQ